MLSHIITSEMILEAFWVGVKPLISIISPYIASGLAMMIIVWIIKRVVYSLSLILGNTCIRVKRNAKKAREILGLVSAINDIRKK